MLQSCSDIEDRKTSLQIEDNNRHYYPILQGQPLQMQFKIKNTGKEPFALEDVISTCGCISTSNSSIKSIPAGKEGSLNMVYESNKNTGWVKHQIQIYGNLAYQPFIEVVFDVHVVPNSLHTKDYEELYREQEESKGFIKRWVDGAENNKGYYLDKDFEKKEHIVE